MGDYFWMNNNINEINSELMKLNEKYLPNYDIILNTSPPRVGKTINTILYHIENGIPAIVFIDNKEQAEDILEDIKDINVEYLDNLYHWKPKADLCYIIENEAEIIENKGKDFFETIQFKNDQGISPCKNCKYIKSCDWIEQKNMVMGHDLILMNKMNIGTSLVNSKSFYDYSRLLFYRYNYDDSVDSRTIIYDEKLDDLHTDIFNEFNDIELKFLNKIIELTTTSQKIVIYNNSAFVDKIETIKKVYANKPSFSSILNEIDFDFNLLGKYDPKIHMEIFFSKLERNIEIVEYLKSKSPPLPIKEDGSYNFEFFSYEKLYIDILFEKIEGHKIILLDATPLDFIVDKLKKKNGFKHISLNFSVFDKKSVLLRICREQRLVKTSRRTLISRNKGKKIQSILEDKSYQSVLATSKIIKENKESKNIKFGVISYKFIKIKEKDRKITFKPLYELKKVIGVDFVRTLHFGNSRGRSELNECEIIYIVGTDRHNPFSKYDLYRYLGGIKAPEELKPHEGRVNMLTYNDELFNLIINHQVDSEMEQVIFRNMPHIKNRLVILEGHFPKHLADYFKEVHYINMLQLWEKTYFPRVIKAFLKSIFSKKPFIFKNIKRSVNHEDTKSLIALSHKNTREIESEIKKMLKIEKLNNRAEIVKLTRKYMSNRYKQKYNCTSKGIYRYLDENYPDLMNKAKISSYSTFRRLYKDEKEKN